MTDPHGVCASRAEVFLPGISYIRGWSDGMRGAVALADQLRAADLAEDFTALRADVNVEGEGLVCLGAVRPEVAMRLSGLIAAGILMEMMDKWSAESPNKSAGTHRDDT